MTTPRRTRSSKAIAASLYAPLIKALADALAVVITAIAKAIATVINAIRRRNKPPPAATSVSSQIATPTEDKTDV
jgi:hypothetical protein